MPATGEWQSSWSVVQTAFPLLVYKHLLAGAQHSVSVVAAPCPGASETLSFHMERGLSCRDGCDWPACTLCSEMSSQVRFLLAELHKEEQLVIWCEHYTSTGFSPSPKASASRRRLDSSNVFWALVVTDSSLCACSQCSCSPAPCVCVCVCFPIQSWNCG